MHSRITKTVNGVEQAFYLVPANTYVAMRVRGRKLKLAEEQIQKDALTISVYEKKQQYIAQYVDGKISQVNGLIEKILTGMK